MNENLTIRKVQNCDSQRILEIYEYYIDNTAITFEILVPTEKEFLERIENISSKYPYLVLEKDDRIIGYAYANILKPREAYRYSVEISIYLDNQEKGKGYGKILYEALENELKTLGITNVYACITHGEKDDEFVNDNSIKFHKKMGFETVGIFKKCGCKFNRWYDVVWLEKIISSH